MKTLRNIFECLILIFALNTSFMIAQDTKELLEMPFEELMNLEITSASKKAEKVSDAPSIISVFSKDQINTYGWMSLDDMLKSQPGFSAAQDYDRRTVSSRGLFEGWNNNHLLMLIDGISFNDNLYGTAYTWEITPLFFAKSVEILRGPGAALYGSNATNGVTAINTVSADDLSNGSRAEVRIGENNTKIFDLLGGYSAENMSIVLGFNAYSTDGNSYNVYNTSADDTTPLTKSEISDIRKSSYFFGKVEGKNEFEGLSLQVHRQDWRFDTGHGWLWETPDFKESMKEQRTIVTAAYKPKSESKFSHEYAFKFQRHNIDWNTRLYNSQDAAGTYPAGAWEYLLTHTDDYFARAQFGYSLPEEADIIAGIETDIFSYSGDDAHYANFDYYTRLANPNGQMKDLGPFLEWIKNKPIVSVSAFTQFSSGKLLSKYVKATLGLRFDNQNISYDAIDKPNKPEETIKYNELSPRLGIIITPDEDLSIKILAGKAFRTPAPTEMFGSNTWLLGSNLRQLKPEYVTTYEAAIDYKISNNLNLRANVYNTKCENQIAYSLQNNNLSTNLYTLSNIGVETELLFAWENISGFINYSFVKRTDEEILDSTIAISKTDLTWYPEHTINMGISYKWNDLSASLLGHWQSAVSRRASDMLRPIYLQARGAEVEAFMTIDAKFSYSINRNFELMLSVKNILDTDAYLVKNLDYPFDYKILGRQIFGGVNIKI